MTDFAALGIGSVFAGRYRIERLLKSGGMGAVYVVRHVKTGAQLALKVMRPEIVSNAAMRERFAQEAQVSSLIESRSVVVVTDAGVDDATGIPFLVMELLRGRELGELLEQRGRFAPADVVAYVTQTARALDKAHAKRIVHRDLKPENLFLTQDEEDEPARVKILDFGIAKIVESTVHAASTQGGGTPLYMAPEQMSRGKQIGPWTDVWALGLIAYTLLVGKPFWEAGTIGELYGEILNSEREPPSVRAARSSGVTLPSAFDAWFMRCVVNDIGARFQRAGEAAAALAEALGRRDVELTPTSRAHVPMAPNPIVALTAPMPDAPVVSTAFMAPNIAVTGSTTQPLSDSGAPSLPRREAGPGTRRLPIFALIGGGVLLASVLATIVVSSRSTRSNVEEAKVDKGGGGQTSTPAAPTSLTAQGATTATIAETVAAASSASTDATAIALQSTSPTRPPTLAPMGAAVTASTKPAASPASKSAPPAVGGAAFDRGAARAALGAIFYKDCGSGGSAILIVAFHPEGRADVSYDPSSIAGIDPTARGCIQGRFLKARVSPFSGQDGIVLWKVSL